MKTLKVSCKTAIKSLLLLSFGCLALPAFSQEPSPVVFAVNEGITYRANPVGDVERYKYVADDLSKILKRPVKIKSVYSYKELADGLAAKNYDLAYVHPAHHSILAMMKSGYSLLAVNQDFLNYKASFMVRSDSTLKSLAQLSGKKIGSPSEDSITAVMMRASLREALAAQPQPSTTYVKLQEAVPFMIENNMVDAGVSASNTVVKQWEGKGGRVLAVSKPIPIKHIIASEKLSSQERSDVAQYFTTLGDSVDGKKRLELINVKAFVPFDQQTMLDLGKWLGL